MSTYLAELGEKPFLLILDDFEWNLEPQEGRYILKSEVASILEALVEAIQETGTDNKIIITCRYEFDSELLEFFFSQGLEPLRKAELTKKLNRLEHFSSEKLSEDIRERALNLADGNPRLLEYLNQEVLGEKDTEAKLTELKQSPELWKDKIIWEELYQLIDEPLQQILSYCLVYEIPVPMVALEAVCDSLPNYQQQLQRGLDLGLIEMSPEPVEEDRVYRVSRILLHIISTIQLPKASNIYYLYQKAHNKLHEIWGHKENESSEKWQEIFRLLFADKNKPERFKQGFFQMLKVQYNPIVDSILESELRKFNSEIPEKNLCAQLEYYLLQSNWRQADDETAWLFYSAMVQKKYANWGTLCYKFSSDLLNEIDQLWIDYSQGQFGFSIQKRIWSSLVRENLVRENKELEKYRCDIIDKFGLRVKWSTAPWNGWRTYHDLSFSSKSPEGQLPARVYMIRSRLRFQVRELIDYSEWVNQRKLEDEINELKQYGRGVYYLLDYAADRAEFLLSRRDLTYKI